MRLQLTLISLLFAKIILSQNVFPFTSVHSSKKENVKIHVRDEMGNKTFLADHMPKERIYLVSVWATWCGACRSELKAIQKVHCKWSDENNFEFIAFSIDAPNDHSKVYAMANKMNWDFKIFHEEYGYLIRELDISKLPRMFLVDETGKIIYEPKGYSTSALSKLEELIQSM